MNTTHHAAVALAAALAVSAGKPAPVVAAPPQAPSQEVTATAPPRDGGAPADLERLRDASPVVDRALGLKHRVDAANRHDLHLLWSLVQRHLAPRDKPYRDGFMRRVGERIDRDAARLERLQRYFRTGAGKARWWDGVELRKAVDQFLGAPGEVVGLYEDARSLAERPHATNPFDPDLPSLDLEQHLIAGLKTLLIYAATVAEGVDEASELSVLDQLSLLYPVPLPASVPARLVEGHTLFDGEDSPPRFLIPNAGFVMGGVPQGGAFRGVDCSAFISHCTGRRERLTTWVMEFCWRELADGVDAFSPAERTVRQEFLEQWGLRAALEDFEAIRYRSPADLRPGDVLVRRWGEPSVSGAREGNSTIYLATQPDGLVCGVECNRFAHPRTGERRDGVIYRSYDLSLPSVDVYVLRLIERQDERGSTPPFEPTGDTSP